MLTGPGPDFSCVPSLPGAAMDLRTSRQLLRGSPNSTCGRQIKQGSRSSSFWTIRTDYTWTSTLMAPCAESWWSTILLVNPGTLPGTGGPRPRSWRSTTVHITTVIGEFSKMQVRKSLPVNDASHMIDHPLWLSNIHLKSLCWTHWPGLRPLWMFPEPCSIWVLKLWHSTLPA